MKDSWFSLIIILICILVIVLCVFNAITYGKIANENKTIGDVTPSGALTLMIINIIICVIFLFPIFVYTMKFYRSGLQGRTFSWVNLMIILVIIALIVLVAFNAYTYAKIANENKTVGDVTPGGARALMIINILLCVVFFIPLVYYIYKMYKTPDNINVKKGATEIELSSILNGRDMEDIKIKKKMTTFEIETPNEETEEELEEELEEEIEEAEEEAEEQLINENLRFQDERQNKIITFLRDNIRNIEDMDKVYDVICHPLNSKMSSKCK